MHELLERDISRDNRQIRANRISSVEFQSKCGSTGRRNRVFSEKERKRVARRFSLFVRVRILDIDPVFSVYSLFFLVFHSDSRRIQFASDSAFDFLSREEFVAVFNHSILNFLVARELLFLFNTVSFIIFVVEKFISSFGKFLFVQIEKKLFKLCPIFTVCNFLQRFVQKSHRRSLILLIMLLELSSFVTFEESVSL